MERTLKDAFYDSQYRVGQGVYTRAVSQGNNSLTQSNFTKHETFDTLIEDDTGALPEFVDSQVSMEDVSDSSLGIGKVAVSQTAMEAVAVSQTAMDAVAVSQTAMDEIVSSQTALDEIVSSQTAMDAVAVSQTAMDEIISSQTALNTVIANQSALNTVVSSQTGMESVAESQTAMNAVIANQSVLNTVVSSQTAMESVAESKTAMDAVANSESAIRTVSQSSLAIGTFLLSTDILTTLWEKTSSQYYFDEGTQDIDSNFGGGGLIIAQGGTTIDSSVTSDGTVLTTRNDDAYALVGDPDGSGGSASWTLTHDLSNVNTLKMEVRQTTFNIIEIEIVIDGSKIATIEPIDGTTSEEVSVDLSGQSGDSNLELRFKDTINDPEEFGELSQVRFE